jgi:hypothetical protein
MALAATGSGKPLFGSDQMTDTLSLLAILSALAVTWVVFASPSPRLVPIKVRRKF